MRRLLPLLIAAGAALGLPAAASADATVTVAAAPAFAPTDVSIQAGQKVNWDLNAAGGSHNILFLAQGAQFPAEAPSAAGAEYVFPAGGKTHSKTFPTAGTFRYLCTIHYIPGILEMKGTVTVTGGTTPPPPPPPATLPPEPVAVARPAGANGLDLFTITGSESASKRLTEAPSEDSDPAWSYDAAHREVAWQSGRNGKFDIFTANADGTAATNVTPGTDANDIEPSWSPDSSMIAFSSDRTGNGDIYVMDFDGGNVRRLTSNAAVDRHPTWSPDGRRIAFASERTGVSQIWIMDVDPAGTGEGTDLIPMNTLFPAPQSEPSWSPVDQDKIVYVQQRGLPLDPDPLVFDVRTKQVTGFLTANGAQDVGPTWSPDGKRVIWSRSAAVGGEADLVTRLATGSGAEDVITKLADGVSYATPAWQPAAKPAKARPVPPPPPPPPPPAGGGGPAPGGEPADTRPDPGTAPAPIAFLGLDLPHRTTVKAFRTLGLAVVARCTGVEQGTARLRVSKKVARSLGLGDARTLARAATSCGPDGRASALLKPRKAVRTSLATRKAQAAVRRGRGLKATLTVTFSGGAAELSDQLSIRLSR